jgi:hypothetical protein
MTDQNFDIIAQELIASSNAATTSLDALAAEVDHMRETLMRQEKMHRLQWAIDHYHSDLFLELSFEDFPRITRVEVILQNFRLGCGTMMDDDICVGYNELSDDDKDRVRTSLSNALHYLTGVRTRWVWIVRCAGDDEHILHYETHT